MDEDDVLSSGLGSRRIERFILTLISPVSIELRHDDRLLPCIQVVNGKNVT